MWAAVVVALVGTMTGSLVSYAVQLSEYQIDAAAVVAVLLLHEIGLGRRAPDVALGSRLPRLRRHCCRLRLQHARRLHRGPAPAARCGPGRGASSDRAADGGGGRRWRAHPGAPDPVRASPELPAHQLLLGFAVHPASRHRKPALVHRGRPPGVRHGTLHQLVPGHAARAHPEPRVVMGRLPSLRVGPVPRRGGGRTLSAGPDDALRHRQLRDPDPDRLVPALLAVRIRPHQLLPDSSADPPGGDRRRHVDGTRRLGHRAGEART